MNISESLQRVLEIIDSRIEKHNLGKCSGIESLAFQQYLGASSELEYLKKEIEKLKKEEELEKC